MKDHLRVQAVNMLKASFRLKNYRRKLANSEPLVIKKRSIFYYCKCCIRKDKQVEFDVEKPVR